MKKSGPDSLNSWLISFLCCFINTMMYGMARLSAMLFVASVTWFGVSRQRASLPYALSNFMRNTSGPLVGYLGHRYGVRSVTTFGCLLATIGVGTCFLAESIDTVTILWGGIFGLGFGLGNVLLPVSINQYFDRHKATASGISFAGACLGSFVLPPIIEIFLNTYGLPGTFLLLSGLVFNCVPAALLLWKPNFKIETKAADDDKGEKTIVVLGLFSEYDGQKPHSVTDASNKESNVPISDCKSTVLTNLEVPYDDKIKRLSTQTLLSEYAIRMSLTEPLDVEKIIENSKGRRSVDPNAHETEKSSLSSLETNQDLNFSKYEELERNNIRASSFRHEKSAILFDRNRALSSGHIIRNTEKNYANEDGTCYNYGYRSDADENNIKFNTDSIKNGILSNEIALKCNSLSYGSILPCDKYLHQMNSDDIKYIQNSSNSLNTSKNTIKSLEKSEADKLKLQSQRISLPPEKSGSKNAFSVFLDPLFILIIVTNGIYCFTFVCVITIIVDFSRDLNIGVSNEKYVLMALSVGDLIGRVGLGWITDSGYMTTTAFTALCFACQGLTTAAVVWSGSFLTLTIIITLYGLSEAGLIVIFPVIIAQCIDSDKQTVAIPSSNFLSGPLCLTVAPIIGYFRDEIGSYDYVFYGITILSMICCVSWILAPYFMNKQTRQRF